MKSNTKLQNIPYGRYVLSLISFITILLVLFLSYYPKTNTVEPEWLKVFPTLIATFNAVSAGLLIGAYVQIRKKNIDTHKRLMLMAFASSAMFMIVYVIYHSLKLAPTPYAGDWGWAYYLILITHIPLAAATVPLALFTLVRGLSAEVEKHRKIARITFPIWMYVSVTGVLIYYMLYL